MNPSIILKCFLIICFLSLFVSAKGSTSSSSIPCKYDVPDCYGADRMSYCTRNVTSPTCTPALHCDYSHFQSGCPSGLICIKVEYFGPLCYPADSPTYAPNYCDSSYDHCEESFNPLAYCNESNRICQVGIDCTATGVCEQGFACIHRPAGNTCIPLSVINEDN